jgi:hypothetical protein
MSVVLMASSACCLALRKPSDGPFLGSHCSLICALGYVVRISLCFARCRRDTCSSCGEVSSTLLSAAPEGMRILVSMFACSGSAASKRVKVSKAGPRERVRVSVSDQDQWQCSEAGRMEA